MQVSSQKKSGISYLPRCEGVISEAMAIQAGCPTPMPNPTTKRQANRNWGVDVWDVWADGGWDGKKHEKHMVVGY